MRKIIVVVALVCCTCSYSFSQGIVKGKVIDTLEKKILHNSAVSLLRKSDSILVKYIRTNTNGEFSFSNLKSGKYILLVTYPKYADYADEFELNNNIIDLGIIPLIERSVLLQEVIVKQNVAIRMKGDTVEYKADSFKVHEGANVQELLRKMPGLQVDRNGQITAQGQKVEKVLVDGEEFFSDDPAVVTKNLRADAVDKVQSFDKKSEQSEFTGVDDGTRSKTLNLVLKEDKKKGYFGKASLGEGTRKRYSDEAMINYFKGKKKTSAYGILSNTGKTGLDWEDRDKFGSGSDFGDANVEVGAGFVMIDGRGSDQEFNDFGSNFYGEGIPRSFKGGAHFSNKWNRDINNINGNYSIRRQSVNAHGSSLTKYILPDSAYYFQENHRNNSTQTRQLLTSYYDLKIDSFASIRVRVNGTLNNTKNQQFTNSESDDENLQPVNKNTRSFITNTDQRAFLASVLWKQKLKKQGRTLSVSVSHKYSDKKSTGFLLSLTDYFNQNGQLYDQDSIDQFKDAFTKTLTTQAKAVYTEPLGKKTILELNYGFNRNANVSNRKSFDYLNGKYEALNPLLSNDYGLEYMSNSAGARYQYNSKKLIANIGLNVGLSNYNQTDSAGKRIRHYHYKNLFPNARINYIIAPQRRLNFTYNGNTQPPTIDQIQPIFENTDPLNILIGNPLLKQSFQHNISMFYSDFKVLTGRSIWFNLYLNKTQNAIVTSQIIDITGKRTQQYVNVNGNNNFGMWTSYGFKLKKPDINININLNGNGGRYITFINNFKNISNTKRIGLGFDIGKYKEEKYDISVDSRVTFNNSVSSISSTGKNTFWTYQNGLDFNYYIKKIWKVGSDVNIDLREKVDAFDRNNNTVTWNAYVSRKIFSKKNAEIRLSAYDILNQRKGFERNISSNFVTEKNYEVLRQYFLLSWIWNFNKNPAVK